MRRLSLTLIVSLGFLVFSINSYTGEIYKWHDEKGKLHIVDDIEKVPEKYRNQVGSIRTKEQKGSVKRSRNLDIKRTEERQRKTREYWNKRRKYEMLISQEERAIERLEQSIENLERARDRAIEQRESLKCRVSKQRSVIKDYPSGEPIVTSRGSGRSVENAIDPSATVEDHDISCPFGKPA